MYSNNLKMIREKNNYTKEDLTEILGCTIDAYNEWEEGTTMIPLYVLDDLSVIYNTKLSYLLKIGKKPIINYQVKPLNYDLLTKNLKELRVEKRYTYKQLGQYLNCTKEACKRYFHGLITIQVDKLILLSNLYDVEIDQLCGKVQ